MRSLLRAALLIPLLGAAAAIGADPVLPAFTETERANARGMLRLARDEVLNEFYDPKRLEAGFKDNCAEVERSLANARSNGEALMMIAQAFLDVGDSHTRFIPPGRRDSAEHGWEFQSSGSAVYVRRVEKGSDAAAKGLRVGDRILAIDGIEPQPADLSRLKYLLYVLVPRPGMSVIVQAPGESPRRLDIAAKITRRAAVRDLTPQSGGIYDLIREYENEDAKDKSLFATLPGDILVWKLNHFDEKTVPVGLRRAGRAKAVVLDLRGNPGGTVSSCHDMLRGFFDGRFLAYTEQRRRKTKEVFVPGRGTFQGPLFVLIDSHSGSGSELFAKLVQIRNRGVLLGERSGGHLSVARVYPLSMGTADKFVAFGVSVTIAELVMPDGSVIEGTGVTPGETVIPTHEDLYLGRDLALARAISLAGHPITPEAAGKLFPATD